MTIDAGPAYCLADDEGREIVGADVGDGAGVAPDRGADACDDESFGHESSCVR